MNHNILSYSRFCEVLVENEIRESKWADWNINEGGAYGHLNHPFEDFGLTMVSNRGIRVSSKEESRDRVLEALTNKPSTARDIVAFNAGLAIYVGNHASSIQQGIKMAFEAIASGAARAKLDAFCAKTKKFAS